jgi:hypothetical protein
MCRSDSVTFVACEIVHDDYDTRSFPCGNQNLLDKGFEAHPNEALLFGKL